MTHPDAIATEDLTDIQRETLAELAEIVPCEWAAIKGYAGQIHFACPHKVVTRKFLKHGLQAEAIIRSKHL